MSLQFLKLLTFLIEFLSKVFIFLLQNVHFSQRHILKPSVVGVFNFHIFFFDLPFNFTKLFLKFFHFYLELLCFIFLFFSCFFKLSSDVLIFTPKIFQLCLENIKDNTSAGRSGAVGVRNSRACISRVLMSKEKRR